MDANVRMSGPLFEGSWNTRVDALVEALVEEPGRMTVLAVQANLDRSLRNPTGAYRSRITLEVQGTRSRTSDNNAVYGPWLERGRTATRFKGYANWRRAAQEMERTVVQISDHVVRQHIGKLGG